MSYFLSQQTLQKHLSQEACSSDSRNTYAKCCHVVDDEASNEQIHEVENEMIDLSSELLRVALIDRKIAEESC